MQRWVGDQPEPVLGPLRTGEDDRRVARDDDLGDLRAPALASLVKEPQRLETCFRSAEQREAVFLGPTMGPLVGQYDPVLVWLEPQSGDQVAPAPAVEPDLVHVHRRPAPARPDRRSAAPAIR